MLWGPDHWDAWTGEEPVVVRPGSGMAILRSTLIRLPDPHRTTVADLACRDGAQARFLASRFRALTVIDPDPEHLFRTRAGSSGSPIRFRCRNLLALARFPERYHLAVATGPFPWRYEADVDRTLDQVRRALVQGGILAAMFPASTGADGPVVLAGGRRPGRRHGFHEVELQYRLRRAGFQGVRIRRADEEDAPVLLALAVRRGFN